MVLPVWARAEQFGEKRTLISQQLVRPFRWQRPEFGIPSLGLSVFHEILTPCTRLKWICLYTICICKQIISTNRNLAAAVLDHMLEHPFISFSWLTAVEAVRDWWAWSTHILKWLAASATVYQQIHILDASESAARLLWCFWTEWQEYTGRKDFKSVKRGARWSEKYMPPKNKRSVWFQFGLLLPCFGCCSIFLLTISIPVLTNTYKAHYQS